MWNVVITKPDGSVLSIPNGFTIEKGVAPKVWTDIVGLPLIRPGRPQQTYHIFYGNSGNVDAALGIPLWISGIPSGSKVDLGFQIADLPKMIMNGVVIDDSSMPVIIDNGTEIVIPLIIPRIPAGYTGSLEIRITTNSIQNFQLQSWTFPPLFTPLSAQNPIANGLSASEEESPTLLDCFMCFLKEAGGLLPGKACIKQTMDAYRGMTDLIWQLETKKSNPELVFSLTKLGFSVIHGLTTCCVEILPATAQVKAVIEVVNKILEAVEKKTQLFDIIKCGADCVEAFTSAIITTRPIEVVTSYDPNDKVGSLGFGENHWLPGDVPLRYAIFFENLDTATAPAQEVVITDIFNGGNMQDLDLSTFSLGPITFGDKVIIPPPGQTTFATDVDLRPDKNLLVRINAVFDFTTGILTWHFTSIDPATGLLTTDPSLGFLPPNTDANAPKGSGSVTFTIMPRKGLATRTQFTNLAHIVFDTNAPINTPAWWNVLDTTKPISQVASLASTQPSTSFVVNWAGTDVGSGVKDYTIYVSENNGPYSAWLSNTTATSGTFTGQTGKTYSFYSVARDLIGNIEDAPIGPDATTQLVVTPKPGDLNSDGAVTCADLAIVKASFGKRTGQAGFDPRADVNKDSVVDIRDLSMVARQLPAGTRCP